MIEKISHEINIRMINKNDISRIDKRFIDQGWTSRLDTLNNYYNEQQIGKRIVLIAEINKDIAGYVTLLKIAKHGPFAGNYPEVADFNVFKGYQKQGIGNRLLERVEQEASKFSETITLGVGMHKGYGSAQRLYIKRGYIPDGTGVWYHNKNIEINEPCSNNDDLAIYLSKVIDTSSDRFIHSF